MRSGGCVADGPYVAHTSVVPLVAPPSGGAPGVASARVPVPTSGLGGASSHGGAPASSRVDNLRRSLAKDGVSERVADFLCESWRDGTKLQYRRYIDKWVDFCGRWEADPFRPPINIVLEFLYVMFHESSIAYRTLNVIRSAVSAVAKVEGAPAGQHPLVSRFMKAAQNLRPAMPRYTHTWDPDTVLTYISGLGHNADMSFLMLSKKLTFLLLLLSGQRFQTVALFDIRNMIMSPTSVCFYVVDATKTSTPSAHKGKFVFPAFPRDKNICVVQTLSDYVSVSAALRGSTTRLLITSTVPYRAVSRDTLIRWTREIMLGAGLDVRRFRPYSVKAAGVSKAAQSLSLKSILSSVGWRRESTFRTFYQMPVVDQGEFGAAVLA